MNTEYESLSEAVVFDETSNLFHNVKLLGSESRNGYHYTLPAMQQAAQLYENRPIYVDHANGPRKYNDRIGTIVNARFEGESIRGDVSLNPTHPAAAQARWDFEHNTPGVGFSHVVEVPKNESDNKEINQIMKVHSVDLVANPATTSTLKESTQEHELAQKVNQLVNELEQMKSQVAELNKEKPVSRGPSVVNDTESLGKWVNKITRRF